MRTKRLLLTLSVVFIAFTAIAFFSSMNYSSEFFTKSNSAIHYVMENITGIQMEQIVPGNQKPSNQNGNSVKSSNALNMEWQEMGPDNFAGRTRAVLLDKDNENVIFSGSAGGGIWKSTTGGLSWEKVPGNDAFENLCVASICQTTNGDIYVGTGEYFGYPLAKGLRGQGIYKSQDHGLTWTLLSSTWNDSDDSKQVFYYVSKLACDPNNANTIYAATAKGLRVSTDGGSSWINPITDSNAEKICTDVQVGSDGQVIVISLNNQAYVATSGINSFVNVSGAAANQIPLDVVRIEFAIAPSNVNYVYCLAADLTGGLKNVYQSVDKGLNWEKMIPVVNNQFSPFGTQKYGRYSNVIKVYPDDPEHLILGGKDLYSWTPSNPWQQISSGTYPPYVKSGIHTIMFSPTYSETNKKLIVGTDGGVFKSVNGGLSWSHLYKNLNTAQFYSVSASGSGAIVGGSRNNGTLLLPQNLTNFQDASLIESGDAGYCEFSLLNPNFIFSTQKYGVFGRSYDGGNTVENVAANVFTTYVTENVTLIGSDTLHAFVTPIRLWESFYDPNSTQYILTEAPKKLVLGDTLDVVSPSQRIIKHIIDTVDLNGSDTIHKYDTLYVKDTYQSMIAIGFKNSIWISRQAHDMSKVPPLWYRPSNKVMNQIQTMEFSVDGDILYYADYSITGDSSRVFRISNLTNGRDSSSGDFHSVGNVTTTQSIGTFPHKVTGIAVDPSNSNNVIVTIGGYDYTNYVYYSFNAATTTSSVMSDNFTSKQGTDLPAMPVYTAVIKWSDSKVVILGTENGIYATEDITASSPVWVKQNLGGMPNVPVMQLRQQTHRNGWLPAPVVDGGFNTDVMNHGYIYAATFGRGIFVCDDFKGPVNVPEIASHNNVISNIIVYPNPVKDVANISYTLTKRSDVKVNIYDLRGNLVKEISLKNVNAGKQSLNFATTGLASGTYIASMEIQGVRNTAKFIVN